MNNLPLFWTLRAIARLERGGFRPPRLTERDQERRLRRKLGWVAFIELLRQDLADTFPAAFALDRRATNPTTSLDETTALAMIDEDSGPDDTDRLPLLRHACRGLGLRDGGNIAELPKVQAHQNVLELAGSGGRIATYQVGTHGLAFHENFTFVADSDDEPVAIGLAAAELRANAPKIRTSAELRAERPHFDHVFGIEGYASAKTLADELGLGARWA